MVPYSRKENLRDKKHFYKPGQVYAPFDLHHNLVVEKDASRNTEETDQGLERVVVRNYTNDEFDSVFTERRRELKLEMNSERQQEMESVLKEVYGDYVDEEFKRKQKLDSNYLLFRELTKRNPQLLDKKIRLQTI